MPLTRVVTEMVDDEEFARTLTLTLTSDALGRVALIRNYAVRRGLSEEEGLAIAGAVIVGCDVATRALQLRFERSDREAKGA